MEYMRAEAEHQPLSNKRLFENDFHQWTIEISQALLDHRSISRVDLVRVAEEILNLGKSEERELHSRLAQWMFHQLKVRFQVEKHTRSWEITIRDQANGLTALLRQQPSLRNLLRDPDFVRSAYQKSLALAVNEIPDKSVIDQLPEECPFTIEPEQFLKGLTARGTLHCQIGSSESQPCPPTAFAETEAPTSCVLMFGLDRRYRRCLPAAQQHRCA